MILCYECEECGTDTNKKEVHSKWGLLWKCKCGFHNNKLASVVSVSDEALLQAVRGETHPISELWDGIESEEE